MTHKCNFINALTSPQAFLEMAEEISAVAMVAYFGGCVAQLRGRAVYVQFSNHKELKTDQTHSNAVSVIGYRQIRPLEGQRTVLIAFFKCSFAKSVWDNATALQVILPCTSVEALLYSRLKGNLSKLLCFSSSSHSIF